MTPKRRSLLALMIYVALAAIMTWPLARHLGGSFPSADVWTAGDPNMYIWYLDWLAKAVRGVLPVSAGQMVFWPTGINPWAGYDGVIMLLIGLPATLISRNPILAYNLYILASFVAAACATHTLVWRLTKSDFASYFAGFAFGFSPYLMVRGLQHPNLMAVFGLPLLALAAWNFREGPRWRTGAWLAAVVFLNGLTSSYYQIGGLILLALMIVPAAHRLIKTPRLAVATAFGVCLAVLLPVLPMMLNRTDGYGPESDNFVAKLDARPLNFILPHPFTNVFGGLTKTSYGSFRAPGDDIPNIFEGTSYFGPILLVLAGYSVFRLIRRKNIHPSTEVWMASMFFFVILALGVEIVLGSQALPLPFASLRHYFPFSLARAPNRFFVPALLSAVVLAAFAVQRLESAINKRSVRRSLAFLLFAGLAAERVIFPYPLFTPAVSDFYRTVGRDRSVYAIVDLPILKAGFSGYDFAQITHGKPIVDGEFFYPAYARRTYSFINDDALLSGSVCRTDIGDVPAMPDKETEMRRLAEAGVRFIVVHNDLLHNEPACGRPRSFIRNFFAGTKPYFADGELTVYRITGI